MIGANIKNYLESKGIKQSFLADAIGVPAPKISDICNGKCGIDCILYWKICKVLEVPYETFMPDETEAI